ncbi:ArdC family protein [Rhodopila sp.]|uniref:ArdC family protein n=1 Tax=Rhodopila sp. TaxID=2480087 RepID=UPI003D14CBAC
MKTDIYEKVTAKIIEALEAGTRPWSQPWNAEHAAGRITRPLRANGVPYNGINVLLLWGEAMTKSFTAPVWCTFKQALELGGSVRKGEHGSMVVYADKIKRRDEKTDEEKIISFMKGYTVFNVEQVDNLPAHFYTVAAPQIDPVQRDAMADAFFKATGANLKTGGNKAYYSISTDHVQLPPFEAFRDAASFYATEAHELTHWTRHESRLNREFGRKRWGDEGYAAEELVAELGAAFLCADLGLTPEIRPDHASYIEHWLKVLKEDKRAIFTAASHAQKAVDFLHGKQPQAASIQHAAPGVAV